ncbi:MAG: hypothetical protein ABW022_14875 [Actinoplanes sp.]
MTGNEIYHFEPQPDAAQSGMYVAVATDKDTGRAIVALDAAAVDALTGLLDDVINSDEYMYAEDDASMKAHRVASAIAGPLLKLQGFLS